jgi:hypothetical protein
MALCPLVDGHQSIQSALLTELGTKLRQRGVVDQERDGPIIERLSTFYIDLY